MIRYQFNSLDELEQIVAIRDKCVVVEQDNYYTKHVINKYDFKKV